MSSSNQLDVNIVTACELTPAHRQYARLRELETHFEEQFNCKADFYVKVPGRVNLIGEHVDYCGYPVLPMALEQCILLAVSVTDDVLELRNMDADKFPKFSCSINNICIAPTEMGKATVWHNYYLCGVKGLLDTLGTNKYLGMRVVVSGNIPPAAGLSSSSALVSAAVLATAQAHKQTLERSRLAAISARCERYIGTQGGGMDQAIAYLAQAGSAQFIEFYPELKATPVQLPRHICFVVAHSLAEKHKAASTDFNERVVECRLAKRFLAKYVGLENWRDVGTLRVLQQQLDCDLNHLFKLVKLHLPQDIYTRSELLELFDINEQEFADIFLTANTQHMQRFKLKQRTLHVIQESMRVLEFRAICEGEDLNGNTSDLPIDHPAIGLSKLLRASHHSLQELYECSHPSLDALIEISDKAGVSARLTGAGWGGFIVALCLSELDAAEYVRKLKQEYYRKLPAAILAQHQPNDFNNVVFVTSPSNGAELFVTKT